MPRLNPEELADMAHRILAVVPGAPRNRTRLDNLAAEIGTLIDNLCETSEEAGQLTEHLVRHPPPRFDFREIQHRAAQYCRARQAPASRPEPGPQLDWYGFKIPPWAFEPHPIDGHLANQFGRFADLVDQEMWRRIEAWPPELRRARERDVLAHMAAYQADHRDQGPWKEPTAEHIRDLLITFALQDHARERQRLGSLEELPARPSKS